MSQSLPRRAACRFLHATILTMLWTAAIGSAHAQTFPARAVQINVGLQAGGAADNIARTLAEGLSHIWGQPVLVANKPGAGGALAGLRRRDPRPDRARPDCWSTPPHRDGRRLAPARGSRAPAGRAVRRRHNGAVSRKGQQDYSATSRHRDDRVQAFSRGSQGSV